MSTNLYEVLEIDKDATPEQIRKAYRKRALQTHPDRLPPGSTPEDKTSAEEQFRQVNNAYEILMDPKNRELYDMHGVWPPPEPRDPRNFGGHHHHYGHHHHHNHFDHLHHHFDHGLFNANRFDNHNTFTFTDPFQLFESIFGPNSAFSHMDDSFNHQTHVHHGGWGPVSFFGPVRQHAFPGRVTSSRVIQSESFGFSNNGGWTQEVRMTSTVNGVTQEMWKRRDSSGNEHITRKFADGREQYTINGVEQDSSYAGMHHDPRRSTSAPQQTIPYHTPPPPYTTHSVYQVNERHRRGNGFPVIPADHSRPDGDQGQKRWWWR